MLAKTSVMVTSEKQSFVWKEYGLRLYIPQGSLPTGLTHCCIKIRAAVSGQFQFPDDSRPVSAVYWLSSDLEEKFSQPLTLEIQHCAIQSAVGELKVVTATTTSHSLPYQFQRLKGGVFRQFSSYGSIQLRHFTLFSAIWDTFMSFISPPQTYYCRIYYTEKISWMCEAHLVITQNLDCYIQVSCSGTHTVQRWQNSWHIGRVGSIKLVDTQESSPRDLSSDTSVVRSLFSRIWYTDIYIYLYVLHTSCPIGTYGA